MMTMGRHNKGFYDNGSKAPRQGHLSGAAVLMATSFTKNSQFPNIVKISFSKNIVLRSIKTLMLHS